MVYIEIYSVNVFFNQKLIKKKRIENLCNNEYNIAWNAYVFLYNTQYILQYVIFFNLNIISYPSFQISRQIRFHF